MPQGRPRGVRPSLEDVLIQGLSSHLRPESLAALECTSPALCKVIRDNKLWRNLKLSKTLYHPFSFSQLRSDHLRGIAQKGVRCIFLDQEIINYDEIRALICLEKYAGCRRNRPRRCRRGLVHLEEIAAGEGLQIIGRVTRVSSQERIPVCTPASLSELARVRRIGSDNFTFCVNAGTGVFNAAGFEPEFDFIRRHFPTAVVVFEGFCVNGAPADVERDSGLPMPVVLRAIDEGLRGRVSRVRLGTYHDIMAYRYFGPMTRYHHDDWHLLTCKWVQERPDEATDAAYDCKGGSCTCVRLWDHETGAFRPIRDHPSGRHFDRGIGWRSVEFWYDHMWHEWDVGALTPI